VDLVDERSDGAVYRLEAEEALYLPEAARVAASGVALHLPSRQGEVLVRAPEARWDLEAERIDLPRGAAAEARGGWSASAAAGRIDLRRGLFLGEGRAAVEGPGLSLKGERPAWNWREGTIALERPAGRMVPLGTRG